MTPDWIFHDPANPMMRRLLTLEEAAQWCAVPTSTVRSWVQTGALRPVPLKRGRAFLYLGTDVAAARNRRATEWL